MDNDVHEAWNAVYCLRPYNPYRIAGSLNPRFVRATDGRLLDFKEGQEYAIKKESEAVLAVLRTLGLPKGTVLTLVPGHEQRDTNVGRPLAHLVQAIVQIEPSYVPSVDGLVRVRTVPKKSEGGSRDLKVDLNSIRVQTPPSLSGATVVVIDDTATTKGSLSAARQLLQAAGAARIAALAIGCTVKYY